MARFTTSISVPRPVEEVFAVLDDPLARPRWQERCARVVVLTPDEAGEGARFREWRDMPGPEGEARDAQDFVVERRDPPRRLRIATGRAGLSAAYDYALAPEGDGTRVTLAGTLSFDSFLLWLLSPLLARGVRAVEEKSLARLRDLLATTKALPPAAGD